MPTTVFTPDAALDLAGVTDIGGTLSWTGHGDISSNGAFVIDQNDDGNLDIGTDNYEFSGGGITFIDATFTGYVVNINGRDYGVFNDATAGHVIPYDSSIDDLSVTYPNAPGTTSTIQDNAVLANCFVTGTLIATPAGERAVETLSIGDEILTTDGRTVAVKWLGRQTVTNVINATSDPAKTAPVCIEAGALGDTPAQDLYLSADHGMIVDGHVINAGALVNGTTVRFVAAADMPRSFTYWHIETEAHDAILANGAASETFIDAAGRSVFDNFDEYLDLYGVERVIPEMRMPRVTAQRLLPESVKAKLGITDAEDLAASA